MRSLARKSTPSPWPFWLLLLAWFCANCPQAATYAVVWLGEARSFSHQQRLTADVARVLVGENTTPLLAGLDKLPPEPPKPSVPTSPSVKKIELAMESTLHSIAPDAPEAIISATESPMESALRAAPPHEPPRAAVVS